jgi:hypothetical protein
VRCAGGILCALWKKHENNVLLVEVFNPSRYANAVTSCASPPFARSVSRSISTRVPGRNRKLVEESG